VCCRQGSRGAVFRHRNKPASVTIPTGRSYVPMVHLRAIQETQSNYDIISRRDFWETFERRIAKPLHIAS
jgi:hypothetical protein